MQSTTVFFRDDDVGELTDPLRSVLEILLEAEVPCHYEVVPSYLDAAAADELRKLQSERADLLFLDQHGCTHSQIVDGQPRASEFDGDRPYEDQFDAISRGRDSLKEMLGDSFSGRVFTPPCHKYDAQTLRALGDAGFDTLSAGLRADRASRLYYAVGRSLGRVKLLGKRVSYHGRRMPDARLVEVSVSLDVHEDVDASGRRIDKDAEQLWQEFEWLRARLPAVGIMLHHQACDTPEKVDALRTFVARLRADSSVRFGRLGALAAEAA